MAGIKLVSLMTHATEDGYRLLRRKVNEATVSTIMNNEGRVLKETAERKIITSVGNKNVKTKTKAEFLYDHGVNGVNYSKHDIVYSKNGKPLGERIITLGKTTSKDKNIEVDLKNDSYIKIFRANGWEKIMKFVNGKKVSTQINFDSGFGLDKLV